MFDSNANLMRSPVWKSRAGSTSIGLSSGPARIIRKRMPGATAAAIVDVDSNMSLAFRSRGTTLDSAGVIAADATSPLFVLTGVVFGAGATRSGAVAAEPELGGAAFAAVVSAGFTAAGEGAAVAAADGSAFVDGKPTSTTPINTAAAAAPPAHIQRVFGGASSEEMRVGAESRL